MNKYYTIIICSIITLSAMGQKKSNYFPPILEKNHSVDNKDKNKTILTKSSSSLWSEDFSNGLPSGWTTVDNSGNNFVWVLNDQDIENSSLGGYTDASAIASTSGGNHMLLFGDEYNRVSASTGGSGADEMNSYFQTTAIPMAGYSGVVVSFQQKFRYCCAPAITFNLVVSTDASFSNFEEFDISGGVDANTQSDDAMNMEVNISSIAGGYTGDIYLRFHVASGASHYYWMVDDIAIDELVDHDIQNLSSWIFGVNSDGIEYGRTPINQLEDDYQIGSSVFNFGAQDQTNVDLNVDFGSFTSTSSVQDLLSDSTARLESIETPTLSVGVYEGTYTVSSDNDIAGGATFSNNVKLRNFEVTEDIYSLDGLDVHPAGTATVSSLGTDSWGGSITSSTGVVYTSDDQFYMATQYNIINTTSMHSVTALLSASSVAGGEVVVHVVDTASFLNGITYQNDIYTSDPVPVTANEISAGKIEIPTINSNGEYIVINPGAYFVALELFSGGGASTIRILDDETVGQPGYASSIFFGNQSPPNFPGYSNGNAFAIRLKTGDSNVGVEEISENKISIFPNPTNGIVNLKSQNNAVNAVSVYDLTGKLVLKESFRSEYTIDLSDLNKGIYTVEVISEANVYSEKVILK